MPKSGTARIFCTVPNKIFSLHSAEIFLHSGDFLCFVLLCAHAEMLTQTALFFVLGNFCSHPLTIKSKLKSCLSKCF